ncbi:MAG: hypothetical protein B0A82_06070 [Alkalinema sp. CACIAM 70d]|nr:MAG: hypothetical protein B0A82_06070 [Alkalinema sp. CACIAM 70d]
MIFDSWLQLLTQNRAIAVIRTSHYDLGWQMANAVAKGGMRLIEVTWDSDRAPELIARLREAHPDCVIGTGTVLTVEALDKALVAGAQFAFSPFADREMIAFANSKEIPLVPGALTPTEILQAWQAGAKTIKVFPVSALGGANYIQSLQDPLKGIPLIPTGGVTMNNAKSMLKAGAIAVGLSGSLFPKKAIETGDWEIVQMVAHRLVKLLT